MKISLPRMGNLISDLRRSVSGGVAVEFAIIAPVFIFMMLAFFDAARLLQINSTIKFAVEEAGRQLLIDPDTSIEEITALARQRAAGIRADQLMVSMETEEEDGTSYLIVTGNYDADAIGALGGKGPHLTLTARARVPRLDD
jgi:Flp pilus assembly protein TadG